MYAYNQVQGVYRPGHGVHPGLAAAARPLLNAPRYRANRKQLFSKTFDPKIAGEKAIIWT